MAATNETASLPTERAITLTRIFDAPREVVFKAWTDPEQLAMWWGPHGFLNPVCEVDAKAGGGIYIVMRAPYGTDHAMKGVFREVVPCERLVFTNNALDENGNTVLEGLTTVTFEEDGDKTKLTIETRAMALVDYAAQYLQGMETGWSQSLERLSELLAKP